MEDTIHHGSVFPSIFLNLWGKIEEHLKGKQYLVSKYITPSGTTEGNRGWEGGGGVITNIIFFVITIMVLFFIL